MMIYELMPVKRGPLKEMRINYRVPPDLVNQLEVELKNKSFSDKSELVTVALREYFNKNEIDNRIRAFLESEEGRDIILNIIEGTK